MNGLGVLSLDIEVRSKAAAIFGIERNIAQTVEQGELSRNDAVIFIAGTAHIANLGGGEVFPDII